MSVPDPLTELLCAWRREISAAPMPVLVDTARAVRVVREAIRAGRVHASPDDASTRTRN